VKVKLKNPDSCDGCKHLKLLLTLAGHRKCEIYNLVMLPMDDVEMAIKKGAGRVERPKKCKEDETEVTDGR